MSPTSASPTASPTNYPSLSPSSVFIMSTIAGTGTGSYSGDNGAATSAGLNNPVGITLDATGNISLYVVMALMFTFPTLSGNLYVAEIFSNRIRKVTVSTGIITTIAGTGASTYSGDNGQATAATLYQPYGVSLDSLGNLDLHGLFPITLLLTILN